MWLRTISTLIVTTCGASSSWSGGNQPLQIQAPNEVLRLKPCKPLRIFKSYRKEVFMDMVAKAKKLIRREICSNVCSQRFSADFEEIFGLLP